MAISIEIIETSDWSGLKGLKLTAHGEELFALGRLFEQIRMGKFCATTDNKTYINIPLIPANEYNNIAIEALKTLIVDEEEPPF